jgi:hypothetical protein
MRSGLLDSWVVFPGSLTIGWLTKLDVYLTNMTGPVSLVMDLRIVHDRFGSSVLTLTLMDIYIILTI